MNTSRTILLCLLCVAWEINSYSQTSIPAGTVSGTWTKAASPYIVSGDVSVPAGQNLTIEPGARILFTGYYKLMINGNLLARGTAVDSIVFDRFDATAGWHSIRVENVSPGSDSTIFEYCRIEHTLYPDGSGYYFGGGNAVLVNDFHKVRISHSLLRNNNGGRGAGVFAINANVKINNNTIQKNRADQYGGGITVEGGSVLIRDNKIEANYAGDGGGGIWLSGPGSRIENNTISYNHSYWSGGGVVVQSNATVSGNLISYNDSDHDDGGGLVIGASPKVINNTIVFNRAGKGKGVVSGGAPQFINNIIYYNGERNDTPNENDEVYLLGNGPSFYHCDIQGGIAGFAMYSGTYSGTAKKNIDAAPLFVNPSSNNFSLTWSNYPAVDGSMSPCIDNGALDTPHDPDGSTADIGARYFHQSAGNFPAFADFVADTVIGYNSLDVHFTDRSVKGNSAITEWHWNFGDGTTSTAQHPVHQYSAPGLFSVALTIKDANGNERSISRTKYIRIADGVYLKGKVLGTLSAPRYVVAGDLLVEETKQLTVTAGVEFVFLGPYKFEVRGSLKALGNAQHPIVFTTYDTETPVRWKGLYLYASGPQDSTVINHCRVNYVANNGQGAIFAFSENGAAGIRISNSEIFNNLTQGIHVTTSKVVVRNNYIHHNNTSMFQKGAGIYVPAGAPKIINNIIAYNEATDDGGGVCVDWDATPFLINNVIVNNKASRGGGICDYSGWMELINNTIAFNSSTTTAGGYYALYAGDIKFTNSIIYNNTGLQVQVADPYTRVGFKNCILEGGSAGVMTYNAGSIFLYENVITADPLLAAGANQHGMLLPGSPAMDAGSGIIAGQLPAFDAIGNVRIQNMQVDIGAYEYEAQEPLTELKAVSDVNVEEDFLPFVVRLDSIVNGAYDPRFLTFGIGPVANPGLNAVIRNREIHISPKPDRWGDEVVTVNVTSGATTVSTSFVVHIAPVEDPPFFTSESHVTILEDFIGTRPYAINPTIPYGEENQPRTFSLEPSTSDVVNIQFVSGQPVFTSILNRTGSQRFTLTLTEGTKTHSEIFNFTVKNVNDAPLITVSSSITVAKADSVVVPVSVSDVDGDPVEFGGYLGNNNISVLAAQIDLNEYLLLVVGNNKGTSSITLLASDGQLVTELTVPVTISLVTGVEVETAVVFSAYPNPTSGLVTVTGRENSSITLYTLHGEVVLDRIMNAAESTLDLTAMKPGLYLLEIDDGKKRHTFKVLKR